ncbi:hypothetical protein AJ85_11410 [Alkalihalobacillus alcalophilus ATCC 27647 = CGMCC 1.3604]|uniref:Uncharacterized protein n=1 Tax=Alkalihalobacillus alcalophilus ATCC 27647 = CGMCC 1.3604 TaxID=1218173 RepID=A0A4S4JYI6_ALKAL|nr:hypothetical protein AJ85_11410 [Alkalihalobacillus alcalophilus ATCC 27647 = CGMCC 1.3604]
MSNNSSLKDKGEKEASQNVQSPKFKGQRRKWR